MTKDEALRLALWALDSVLANHNGAPVLPWIEARDATKAALEVPQRTWVGLTDEELDDCYDNVEWNTIDWCPDHRQLAIAVEAKLKEKNT